MVLSELQKGFGPALLRASSPEGKLIAELQAAYQQSLLTIDVTVPVALIQAAAAGTLVQLLAAPGVAEFYDLRQVDALFLPGTNADTDPLVQAHNYPFGIFLGDPANRQVVLTLDATLQLGGFLTGTVDPTLQVAPVSGSLQSLSGLLGQGFFLGFVHGNLAPAEVVTGNAAGDAALHLRLRYGLRNLDF